MVWALLVIMAAVVFVMIDVPRLRRKKAYKELWVFAILLATGVGLGIAQSMRVQLPNPLDLIFFVFRPISDWLSL
jgi:hypothetical protein